MIFLQLHHDLNSWVVVALGVAGSILGRYVPTRYIPKLSGNSSRAPRTRMCTCWVRG